MVIEGGSGNIFFGRAIGRRGSRIQKGGGVRTFRRGGFVQEFQERIQIVAGPWANQQANKKLQTAVGGGGPITPKKNLYPCLIRLYCSVLGAYVQCVRQSHGPSASKPSLAMDLNLVVEGTKFIVWWLRARSSSLAMDLNLVVEGTKFIVSHGPKSVS